MSFKLLSREDFRDSVFKRDNFSCIFCKKSNVKLDAHHIFERRLWDDGGYYIENGASLCEDCHKKAESTEISVKEIQNILNITKFPLPNCLEENINYDKWGNEICEDNTRIKGILFDSHKECLKDFLHLFSDKNIYKYPRTFHLPWSPGASSDDKMLKSVDCFKGKKVVVTEKMDGENTTLYNNFIHARSIEGYSSHESRSWMKTFHASICHDIPENYRICGENLFAKHSIEYNDLTSYFQGFSIFNDKNICLSWKETLEYFELLNITPVKTLFEDNFDVLENTLKNYIMPSYTEGYVVRLYDEFKYSDFSRSCAKYVRKNHVQTNDHWKYQKIIPNKLKND